MDKKHLVKLLEDAVYSHSKYIDRCRILLKKHKDVARLSEVFANLAKISKRIERLLTTIKPMMMDNLFSAEEIENLTLVAFYVYEVAVEEERSLWSRYKEIAIELSNGYIEEHFARIDRMKKLAQEVLESRNNII